MVKIIADPGSCHMGRIDYAFELIETAAHAGCDAIKFQLFKAQNVGAGNIQLPREWWPDLCARARSLGIEISASAFDWDAVRLLIDSGAPWIKFSYSCRMSPNVQEAAKQIPVIVSCGPMDVAKLIYSGGSNWTTLFCVPEYPVLYDIDFSSIFHLFPFDGFSDHTLGFGQTIGAVRAGAQVIEKHITLDHPDIDCPDHAFALHPKVLEDMVKVLRYRTGDVGRLIR
ncbi:MAG TPA: N-acetylneuraminate synthase family protein [Candidatus Omnitrophota bacterium]|nr:N-acetylneuraminate synthase family protein [Candidatus Omnitrophota bacterium]